VRKAVWKLGKRVGWVKGLETEWKGAEWLEERCADDKL
jgi:hypothetical protein